MTRTSTLHCPACGESTSALYEGYCEPCRDERQHALDTFNTGYDAWNAKSDAERERAIRFAMELSP